MKFWSKLKTWKKGAILGGIWGLISGILISFIAGVAAMAGGEIGFLPQRVSLRGILAYLPYYTILLPGYLAFWITFSLYKVMRLRKIPFTDFDITILISPISMGVGIILSFMISKAAFRIRPQK